MIRENVGKQQGCHLILDVIFTFFSQVHRYLTTPPAFLWKTAPAIQLGKKIKTRKDESVMPGASRVGDCAKCPFDAHGCKACSHSVTGPVTQGSNDVIINGKPAARAGDSGIHGVCCGLNKFTITGGAPSVFFNGKPAARQTDTTIHCGGIGNLKQGSSNVIIGNGMGKLVLKAAKNDAPFVENLNANNEERSQRILQQNIDYLKEKGFSGSLGSKLPEENIVQRTKRRLKEYIDERGAKNYAEGHKAAAFIDAIGSTMLDDVPETPGAAAANIGISLIFGKALQVIGKGARKLLMNLDKISEPLQSKIKLIFKKADAGKKLTDTDRKVIAEALDEIDGKATKSDDFVGKLKGEPVPLPKVKMQRISYTKRSQEATEELRKQFNTTEKKKFLQNLTDDPNTVEQLKKMGLSEKEIAKMRKGKNPNVDWQVHHKLPLDDGGTNSMDNLVLIKNDPYHKTITNAQKTLVKDLNPGETKMIDWPIPEGQIYPLGD